jgi:hypothetical protein
MTLSTGGERWIRNPTIVWRAVPGFLVLADAAGDVTRAEGPAPDIWQLLAEPRTLDDVTDELAATYGAPADEVRTDVARFLVDLAERGFVDRVAARP